MTGTSTLLARIADGEHLTRQESAAVFERMAGGELTDAQTAGLLLALRTKGETVEEIVGAVTAMRARMRGVTAPDGATDVVGTGGDGSGSHNISTCAAFVVAGAGVPVAKHGNRALSSRCGAADVLRELGVRIGIGPDGVEHCLRTAGIGFMFAPDHHPALSHVGSVRAELGTRTVFNLLGPMLNPAGVRRHLVGVYSPHWVEPVARVLGTLGSVSALVVHGRDGLDEITTTGPTLVATLRDGTVSLSEVSPADAGLATADPSALRGGDAATNAAALREVLDGRPGAYRDVAVLNAGAALVAAGRAPDLASGVTLACDTIDDGRARERLDRLVTASHGAGGPTGSSCQDPVAAGTGHRRRQIPEGR